MSFKKLPNGIKFLALTILLYLLTAAIRPGYAFSAFVNAAKELGSLLPILIFVFFVNFLVNLWVKPELIRKHLGHDAGFKGWLYAVFGAMVMIGPPYILFPILGDLKKHGAKDSLLAAFLNNRSVQPIFMPVMAHYFGIPFTATLFALTFIFSFPSSILVEKLNRE